jgi:hypothetical protein
VRGLATEAGAEDPEGLARSLTLLLDGGLASGALDADPEVATRTKQTAAALVELAVGQRGRREDPDNSSLVLQRSERV